MIKFRSKHLICGLLATTILATPALAQSDPDAVFVPPVRQSVDDNGVDLSSGFMTVAAPGISIGSAAQGLSYQRTLNQSSYNYASWDAPYHYAVFGTAGTSLTVAAGGRSFDFTFNSATGLYDNKQGSGETLTGSGTNWTFTMRDGTVVQMDASDFDPAADSYNNIAIARTITLPNKVRLTLAYKHLTAYRLKFDANIGHARLQSVQSSNGYMAKMDYANDGTTFDAGWINVAKVTLLNLAVDYCNPAADSCTFTQTWPSLTFAENGATQTVTDTLNRATIYNTTAGLTSIRRPGSATDNVTIAHDATGKVTSLTRDGRTWSYSWSLAAPLMTATITNPDQSQEVIVTDTTVNQVKSDKDERGYTTSYTYDTLGRPTLITYPEGNKLKYTYDTRGNVTEQRAISKTPNTPPDIVISASYSLSCANALICNKPNSTTDARGNVTTFAYDPTHGGVLTVTSPAPTTGAVQPQTRYSYATRQAYFKNSAGSIVASGQSTHLLTGVSACQTLASCIGTADEVKTAVDYGPQLAGTANNLLTMSVSKGAGNAALPVLQTNTYDWVGNVTYVDGALPGNADLTRTIYDAGRQVVGQIGPDPDGGSPLLNRATRTTYNPNGQVTKLEQGTTAGQSDTNWASFAPAETVDVKYDAAGLAIEQKLSGSGGAVALTQTSYDSMGQPTCSAVRMNTAIYTSLPTSACMLGTQGSFGPDQISRTVYDAAGQVTQVQTAVGTANQTNEQTLTYTINGKVQTLTDGENNKTTYTYDGFDRLSQTQFPNKTTKGVSDTSDYEQPTYDAGSNIYSRRIRSGEAIDYRYDALNRLILKAGVPITDVSYGYDNLGRLLTAKFATAGTGITNSYDALGRLMSSSSDVSGTAQASSYQYDLAGRRTRLTYPGSGLYVDYDYLVTGEMTKIRENGATTGIGVLATFAYDNLGRRTSITYGNGTNRNYAYDPVSRLAGLKIDLAGTADDLVIGKVGTEGTAIAYNPASQITSIARSNDAFAYLDSYNVNRPYTANGLNQYSAPFVYGDGRGNLTSDGTVNYAYDAENRLTSTTGALTASLAYDPLLRLYQVVGGPTTTRFAYDGLDAIAEYDGSNLVLRRYVHGPGMDEPLVQYEGSGTADRRFLAADERGSIVAVSDSSGNLLGTGNSYDEYGIPAGTNTGRFQYTGQMWLPEVGLYYYKNRMYSPISGRFLQTDPTGYGDGMNIYAYVHGDPVNLTDPLGLGDIGLPPTAIVYGHRPDAAITGDVGGPTQLNNGSSSNEPDQDIVVRGNRIRVISVLKTAGSIVVPGWDFGACVLGGGCSGSDWAWATADLIPAGKLLSKGRKGWKALKAVRRACGCLEAGTLVATPDGLVAIEQIKVGDLVMAKDERTGEIAAKPVTDLIRPEPKPLYKLTLRNTSGEVETFHATDDHPWKVEGKGWVETAHLKTAQRIETAKDGALLIESLMLTKRVEATYNLTVDDWHTFLVGKDGAIVHNANCKARLGKAKAALAKNPAFKKYFHKEKQKSGLAGDGAGQRNSDMENDFILEVYENWLDGGN